MKTYLKIFFCLLLHISSRLVAQTVTDPAKSDPNYASRKWLAAQNTIAANRNILSQVNTDSSTGVLADANQPLAAIANSRDRSCFIPLDYNTYTKVPKNDDGSYGPIDLPFNYRLYGTIYKKFWINTNGNLTFTGPFGEYKAGAFPTNIPMVAPFWADIDVSGEIRDASEAIYFKVSNSNVIVTWNGVGYYNNKADKVNTFQVIITNGLDPIIGVGNNTAFYYADMQWTTGDASGGVDGFEGIPATVGINKGDGVNYALVGKFDNSSSDYSGPDNGNNGVRYLDYKCFNLNVGNTSNVNNIPPVIVGLPATNSITINVGETVNLPLQLIGPEVDQRVNLEVDTKNLCNVTITKDGRGFDKANLQITGAACNVGTNTITLKATDVTITDFSAPELTTTVNLIVNVRQVVNVRQDQSIIFTPPPSPTFGVAPFPLTAIASSGLPVSFDVVSGPAAISGNMVTLTGVGTAVIRASQAGNYMFNPASVISSFTVTAPPVSCTASGFIVREQYSTADLAAKPEVSTLTSFEANNKGDFFAARILGYICPPQTGNYTFWISGDDATRLTLSTDANPANAKLIAYSSSRTNFRQYNKYPSQKSVPVYLDAGKKYYIEAQHAEFWAGDYVTVAWQLPNGTFEGPIPGSRLSPYESNGQQQALVASTQALRMQMREMNEAESITMLKGLTVTPNPFADKTTIDYVPAEAGDLQLEVFTTTGKLVRTLYKGQAKAGSLQQYVLDSSSLANGVYVCRVTLNNKTEYKRIMLLR